MTSKQTSDRGGDIIKHPLPQRALHWFNAACFLFLFLTGIGIVTASGYRVAPQSYVDSINWLFGGHLALLQAHWGVGFVWFGVLAALFVVDPVGLSLRFLKDLVPTANDLRWFKQRGPHELDPAIELPPQSAYNAGQKAFGWTVLLGVAGIGLTGVLMVLGTGGGEVSRWMVFAHLLLVGGVMAFFFVHFTMAAFITEERPALVSMYTGSVTREYAEHHHSEWYEAQGDEGAPIVAEERFALPRTTGHLLWRGWQRLVGRDERPEWSPYAAGVGLGLVVLAGFMLMGHGPGASGFFSRLGAFSLAAIAPDHVASNAYWGPVLDQGMLHYWLLWAALGITIGGFASAALGGRLEAGIDRGALVSPGVRILLAVLGGALVGFATRFTRGCTSSQALSGGALLSVGSWVFMLSVFAGGFAAAFFLRRVWR